MPGIVGGWIFAAILSFNEFTGTVFVVSQSTRTLPVSLYNYVRENTDPSVAAIASLYIAGTMLLILGAFAYFGPRNLLQSAKHH